MAWIMLTDILSTGSGKSITFPQLLKNKLKKKLKRNWEEANRIWTEQTCWRWILCSMTGIYTQLLNMA